MGHKTTIKISKATRDRMKTIIPKSQTFDQALKEWVDKVEAENKKRWDRCRKK